MTREPPCPKCNGWKLVSACTRLECPRQTEHQQAEVRRRWNNAVWAWERREPTNPVMARAFEAKGWTVRRAA